MRLGSTLENLLKDPNQYAQQIKGHYLLLKGMDQLNWLDRLSFSSKLNRIVNRDNAGSSG